MTTGAALCLMASDDVEVMSGDVGGLYRVLMQVDSELLEEVCDMWEDAMSTEAAQSGELTVSVD